MYFLKFDWNPVTGIDIVGNFKLHFYSLMWIIAFVVGWYIMKRIFTKEKISLTYILARELKLKFLEFFYSHFKEHS